MIHRELSELLTERFGQETHWPDVKQWWAVVAEVRQLHEMCLKCAEGVHAALPVELQSAQLLSDLREYAKHFLPLSLPKKLINDSDCILDANGTQLFYIGAELSWLVNISRSLGLIPFQTLLKLRTTRVRVLGASVAASTIDLLASLGCEDISFVDDGLIDHSNIPRLPMANVQNIGVAKSQALALRLLRRNPYGNFRAVIGKAVKSAEELLSEQDVTADAFIADADVIIEVVDDIQLKSYLHTVALAKKPNTPLIFIADLGNEPVVKVVRADENGQVEKPFGREWTIEERKVLMDVQRDPSLIPQAAYMMVKDDLPPEHTLQFLLYCKGVMPFWSQTPIASRVSAAQAALAVIKEIGGVNDAVLRKNSMRLNNVLEEHWVSSSSSDTADALVN